MQSTGTRSVHLAISLVDLLFLYFRLPLNSLLQFSQVIQMRLSIISFLFSFQMSLLAMRTQDLGHVQFGIEYGVRRGHDARVM